MNLANVARFRIGFCGLPCRPTRVPIDLKLSAWPQVLLQYFVSPTVTRFTSGRGSRVRMWPVMIVWLQTFKQLTCPCPLFGQLGSRALRTGSSKFQGLFALLGVLVILGLDWLILFPRTTGNEISSGHPFSTSIRVQCKPVVRTWSRSGCDVKKPGTKDQVSHT
jgi:hypothetical protein